jgi:uracil DNA glycosylase superfamily protein
MVSGRCRTNKAVHVPRLTHDVIAELLTERDRLVTDYGSTNRTCDLVSWTSLFPGGAGLWQGNEKQGEPLPIFFPTNPYMFVAHNYDGSKSYERMLDRGWERRDTAFWETLWAYLAYVSIQPSNVFMTNVFMGLRTGAAVGTMEDAGPLFEEQCLAFFQRQVEIVQPRLVIVMGEHAWEALRNFESKVYVPHPSACRDSTKRAAQVPKKVAALVAAMAAIGSV